MPTFISIDDVQIRLKRLIEELAPGDEIVITDDEKPVARLVAERTVRPQRPAPGMGKGSVVYMAPDFDEPMDEFREYEE